MLLIIGVVHTIQLHHIDLLYKMPIEKTIIYIKMVNFPLAIECNAKHSTNGDNFYHGIESHVKVIAQLLVKAFRNKASFIQFNRVVGILSDAKHLFVAHYILPRSQGN